METSQHQLSSHGYAWRGHLAAPRTGARLRPSRVITERAMELVRLAALAAVIFAPLIGRLAERRVRRTP